MEPEIKIIEPQHKLKPLESQEEDDGVVELKEPLDLNIKEVAVIEMKNLYRIELHSFKYNANELSCLGLEVLDKVLKKIKKEGKNIPNYV